LEDVSSPAVSTRGTPTASDSPYAEAAHRPHSHAPQWNWESDLFPHDPDLRYHLFFRVMTRNRVSADTVIGTASMRLTYIPEAWELPVRAGAGPTTTPPPGTVTPVTPPAETEMTSPSPSPGTSLVPNSSPTSESNVTINVPSASLGSLWVSVWCPIRGRDGRWVRPGAPSLAEFVLDEEYASEVRQRADTRRATIQSAKAPGPSPPPAKPEDDPKADGPKSVPEAGSRTA